MISELGPDNVFGMEDLVLNYKRTSFTIKVDSADATVFFLERNNMADLLQYVSMQEKIMAMVLQ